VPLWQPEPAEVLHTRGLSLSEFIGIAIGCTLTALGAASIGAWGLRRRAPERLLLFFGIWCVLYGVRLTAAQPAVHVSLGGSDRAWSYLIAFITYSINIPSGLFLESLIGPGWKQSIRRMWQLQVGYAVAAMSVDIVSGRPNVAMPLNDPLVLVTLSIQAVNLWMYRLRLGVLFKTPIIVGGTLALLLAAINQNLGRPVLPAVNLEPVGVLVFVVALAYGVVGNVVRGEAELMAVRRELETAREIQQSLLPRDVPHIRGLDVAVQFIPMTAVAGDLYDFVDLGPSRIGILVADVSGHGIPAALVASMVKLAFSTSVEQAHDPALVLTAINRALCRQLEQALVTAVYGVIDTELGLITVANAGHPPPLIGRADRSVVEIHHHGLFMGFMADASYSNMEIKLQEGDLILLYTDGVVEAQNAAGDFFDRDRVKAWLTSADRGGAARFSEAALADLNQWCGNTTFNDDVSFVAAHFTVARQLS
jgi:hypothetical protein